MERRLWEPLTWELCGRIEGHDLDLSLIGHALTSALEDTFETVPSDLYACCRS